MTNHATVIHHSISRARQIEVSDNLTVAKRQATAEFGSGFRGHQIVIRDERGYTLAHRIIGYNSKWVTL